MREREEGGERGKMGGFCGCERNFVFVLFFPISHKNHRDSLWVVSRGRRKTPRRQVLAVCERKESKLAEIWLRKKWREKKKKQREKSGEKKFLIENKLGKRTQRERECTQEGRMDG